MKTQHVGLHNRTLPMDESWRYKRTVLLVLARLLAAAVSRLCRWWSYYVWHSKRTPTLGKDNPRGYPGCPAQARVYVINVAVRAKS